MFSDFTDKNVIWKKLIFLDGSFAKGLSSIICINLSAVNTMTGTSKPKSKLICLIFSDKSAEDEFRP